MKITFVKPGDIISLTSAIDTDAEYIDAGSFLRIKGVLISRDGYSVKFGTVPASKQERVRTFRISDESALSNIEFERVAPSSVPVRCRNRLTAKIVLREIINKLRYESYARSSIDPNNVITVATGGPVNDLFDRCMEHIVKPNIDASGLHFVLAQQLGVYNYDYSTHVPTVDDITSLRYEDVRKNNFHTNVACLFWSHYDPRVRRLPTKHVRLVTGEHVRTYVSIVNGWTFKMLVTSNIVDEHITGIKFEVTR